MTTHEIKHKLYVEEWAKQLRAQQESGLNVQDWCRANNIPLSTFSSHNRAVRQAFMESNDVEGMFKTREVQPVQPSQLTLTQVHLESSGHADRPLADIHIEIRGICVDINNSADLEHVGYIMGVIMNVK